MKSRKEEQLQLIKYLSEEKEIDINVVISFLKNSIQRNINADLDPDAEISLEIKDNELILTNHKKLVVSDDEDYENDSNIINIRLSDAQKINPNAKIDDYISDQIQFEDFSRKLYSKIEQSFKIEIVKWEKKRIYQKYLPLIGQEVEAKLEDNFGNKGATFKLEDGTLCYMPTKYLNPAINLDDKTYHKVTIEEVYEDTKNYQVLVSNDSPNKVREILKNEIPEIEEGIIQIVGLSRIKGERSKISFRKNPDYPGEVDVVGSVIGPNGSRINRVCELFGEKIDVVLYSDNIYEYIANALSPAKIVSINKKPSSNDYLVIVPDRHNTLAIGKKGSNVKLAVQLIRVDIDICSYSYALESQYQIHWNGNITEEELKKINSEAPAREMSHTYSYKQNNRSRNNGFFNINLDELEKDIAEFNEEIAEFENSDLSDFFMNNFNNKATNENSETESETKTDSKNVKSEAVVDEHEIKKVNENFKFDKDIVGDINLDDYDFSDFEDDDFK